MSFQFIWEMINLPIHDVGDELFTEAIRKKEYLRAIAIMLREIHEDLRIIESDLTEILRGNQNKDDEETHKP